METLIISIIIILIIIFSVIFFLIGAAVMARWTRSKNAQQPIEKPPTRNSIYADHVIQTAAQIYCNYNKSKIIRLGEKHPRPNNDRYGETLNEAFNLVGKAYAAFDKLDHDEKQVVN